MTYEQVIAVKGLAAPVNKVLERLEWDCPDCKDKVMHQGLGCKYSGKVKYTWTPQIGEWCIVRGDVRLITGKDCIGVKDIGFAGYNDDMDVVNLVNIIPILPWEECFEILVKAGYPAQMEYTTGHKSFCTIKRPGLTCSEIGSSPTEATYKAILRLGKAIK